MFERFDESARRSIFFSRFEARKTGTGFVEVPHLLLSLAREDWKVRRLFTRSFGADTYKESLHELLPAEKEQPMCCDLPLSHEVIRIIETAATLSPPPAKIETQHLLFAIIQEQGCK